MAIALAKTSTNTDDFNFTKGNSVYYASLGLTAAQTKKYI